jgi:hypothetical protein
MYILPENDAEMRISSAYEVAAIILFEEISYVMAFNFYFGIVVKKIIDKVYFDSDQAGTVLGSELYS